MNHGSHQNGNKTLLATVIPLFGDCAARILPSRSDIDHRWSWSEGEGGSYSSKRPLVALGSLGTLDHVPSTSTLCRPDKGGSASAGPIIRLPVRLSRRSVRLIEAHAPILHGEVGGVVDGRRDWPDLLRRSAGAVPSAVALTTSGTCRAGRRFVDWRSELCPAPTIAPTPGAFAQTPPPPPQ